MTLAFILVVCAVLTLAAILAISASRSLQVSRDANLAHQIQPLDLEAFRNLTDPGEDDFLRRRLSDGELRLVRRERLRAALAYVQTARRNAAILTRIGQSALAASDAATLEAARQLVSDALLLRHNATVALLKIYLAIAVPGSDPSALPILTGYEQLSGSAMLLGRLQNPSAPVRIATW